MEIWNKSSIFAESLIAIGVEIALLKVVNRDDLRLFFMYFAAKMFKFIKKIKKNQKKCKKICTYKKNVLPLHRQTKKTTKS